MVVTRYWPAPIQVHCIERSIMHHDIRSLKLAALAMPLDAPEFEPATSFLNSIRSIQVHQAESMLRRIAEDIREPEHRRSSAGTAFEDIKSAKNDR